MLNVYVATSYGNFEQARAFIARVREAGFHITVDWTDPKIMQRGIEAGLTECWEQNRRPEGEALKLAQEVAVNDIWGVTDADALVVLFHPKMQGAWAECGAALADGVPVAIVSELTEDGLLQGRMPVFAYHPLVDLVPNEDTAMGWLTGLWRKKLDTCRETGRRGEAG